MQKLISDLGLPPGEKWRYSFPYFSTVRFSWVRSGAGPFVYTLSPTPIKAFSYAQGDAGAAMAAAGYSSTWASSLCETNLQTKFETISGESVWIKGIGAILMPWSDARLSSLVWSNVGLEVSLNGDSDKFKLGNLNMVPGGAGLTGAGKDDLGPQAIAGGRPQFGFVTNGLPVVGNVFRMPEGLIWRNKGQRDSLFNIVCTPGRAVSFTGQLADESAAAGIRGYANPTPSDTNVVVDVCFYLIGQVVGNRTLSK